MTKTVPITKFMSLRQRFPVIDVRTPAEFSRGHCPGAANLPLFSDQERAAVGAVYKQQSREAAILLGLDYVGPKMRTFLEKAQALVRHNTLLFYCWRGGMRSQSLAWLAELYGYQTYTLEGGYKAFRRYVLTTFARPAPVLILGGKTGSGKTDMLRVLAQKGQQIIDLEGLARHKGSVFGGLGQPLQPSQQQFENELGLCWRDLRRDRPVWLEDESRSIGQVVIPQDILTQMTTAPHPFCRNAIGLAG